MSHPHVMSLRLALIVVAYIAAVPLALAHHDGRWTPELVAAVGLYTGGWVLAGAAAYALSRWMHRRTAESLRRLLAVRAAWAAMLLTIAAGYSGIPL